MAVEKKLGEVKNRVTNKSIGARVNPAVKRDGYTGPK